MRTKPTIACRANNVCPSSQPSGLLLVAGAAQRRNVRTARRAAAAEDGQEHAGSSHHALTVGTCFYSKTAWTHFDADAALIASRGLKLRGELWGVTRDYP